MASIFITGSTDGIGAEIGRALVAAGHRVVLHSRNDERAEEGLLDACAALTGVRLPD